MKLLITGGTGGLGQALIRLYAEQHEILFTGRKQGLGDKIAAEYGAQFLPCDLADKAGLQHACKGMDAVIHCAALSSPWGTREEFLRHNVEGTQNLIEACKAAGVKRLVHISTSSVYFHYHDDLDIRENRPNTHPPCNHYAESKRLAEERVLDSGLDAVILRPRGIFGPGDTAIVPRVLNNIKDGVLRLPSKRNPLVDLTYVDNVAEAAMLAAQSDLRDCWVFNISNKEPMRVLDIFGQLFNALGLEVHISPMMYHAVAPLVKTTELLYARLPGRPEPRLTHYSAALLHYQQTLNIDSAQTHLGYQPTVSISEGIQRYAHWHQTQTA